MKFVHLTESLFEIQSNSVYNILIPFISRVTRCKIFISNFKYENPRVEIVGLRKILKKNVS